MRLMGSTFSQTKKTESGGEDMNFIVNGAHYRANLFLLIEMGDVWFYQRNGLLAEKSRNC